MELWFTENQTASLRISVKASKVLEHRQTGYQELSVLETEPWGTMLALDGMIQTTERDEAAYHEMMVHVPLSTHPRPRRVAVIGGGDGGAIREVLKHPSVEQAVLVEIDPAVVEASRRWLPSLSSGLDDPRVQVVAADGRAYVQQAGQGDVPPFDVIVVDSTDPVRAAVGLFSEEFYRDVRGALAPGGILTAQTESPYLNRELLRQAFRAAAQVFPLARLYLTCVPTYPSGLWSFTLGSLGPDPLDPAGRGPEGSCRYYTPELHRAAFALPAFVTELIRP
ncbi:polyamine aminopropyltransferase [Limnochorda pilosa]|uniref:Polyamine aminopropyltransferase n=1 Tax=Limnochorda pilosa TaxID=1555112 RepID=A0A0K2SPE5_LIMPI|nr:polyamine aminopropyltransferase [Limnochorda pilosa]BAS28976.1 spermidine synthase [Limnochorda pilosa]